MRSVNLNALLTCIDERAVRAWDLNLIRKELARLGLDWPLEVLRAPHLRPGTTPLEISFDRGPQGPK